MKPLKIFNSLTGNLEDFQPVNKPFLIGLYTCGPTVYSHTHIGHLRTYVIEDIFKKNLIHNGFLVEHAMNITDVGHLTSDGDVGDDKIEKQAKKENKSAYQIASFYTKDFFWNLKQLNITTPSIVATVTGNIKEQITLIQKLEKRGYIYKTSDGMYFDTSKVQEYKTLFNQNKENLKSDDRIENASEKKNPTDFAVWKFSPKNEKRQMEWKSPWGVGFPGWHTECVAISTKHLGKLFDIHCGGVDHIPVHHPNEIAQSLALNNTTLAKYWMHVGFLLKNSEKMSKSTGNFDRLIDLINKGYHPLALRYFILNSNYRKTTDFSYEALTSSQNALFSIYEFADKIKAIKKLVIFKKIKIIKNSDTAILLEKYRTDFFDHLNDDLNTPKALETLWGFINEINKNIFQFEPNQILDILLDFDKVLDLKIVKRKTSRIPFKIKLLAQKRFKAKKKKDFALSDKIRETITNLGFQINDYQTFYTISKKQ